MQSYAMPESIYALATPSVTVLPSSPYDGQEVYFIADATLGILWHLRYNLSSSSAYKWEFVGGSSLEAEVDVQNSTSSTTFTDLATPGPSVTVPLVGDYLVEIGAHITGISGADCSMSYAIGATAASVNDNVKVYNVSGGNIGVSRVRRKNAIPAGSALFCKYATTFGSGTGYYDRRWIKVTPIRVG